MKYWPFVLVVCFVASTVSATEILIIPSDGSIVFSSSLSNGETYWLKVSGTYSFAQHPNNLWQADAEWAYNYYPEYGPPAQWYEELPPGVAQPGYFDLVINGQDVDWMGTADGIQFAPHTYSPSHVYRLKYVGTGAPISFQIIDSPVHDNVGSLIVAIPEPAGATLLALGGLTLMCRRW